MDNSNLHDEIIFYQMVENEVIIKSLYDTMNICLKN